MITYDLILVGLGNVGLVLGVEMSRLARPCRDWHQLLEICALFDTLIADADGVYDPAIYNDRLLLGLKGTMSEAELHILKARMLEGRRAKARRGELGKAVPMGYLVVRRAKSCSIPMSRHRQRSARCSRCSSGFDGDSGWRRCSSPTTAALWSRGPRRGGGQDVC